MNKLPLWALEIGPLQNFTSFFSSSLQRAQKANYITNFVILAILTSKGCPTLVFVFKPEGPLLGGCLFYLIELKHRLDDLPQKSNTGSDRSNDNNNIFHMPSWDHWTRFSSCQNWTLSSSAWYPMPKQILILTPYLQLQLIMNLLHRVLNLLM